MTCRRGITVLCLISLIVLSSLGTALSDDAAETGKEKKKGKALERARNTVRMLDDIYKTTVVLITDKYVNDEDDFPAGSAAIALFDAINKKNWHQVRLVDATGEPTDDKNVATDDFEKEAVKQLLAGKDYYEQVEKRDDARYLRAATPVPVVMDKCIMCHDHYKDAKEKGLPIGVLLYTLKVE
jgi:hypothetical protein